MQRETLQLGVSTTAERWMRVRRAMRKEDQIYAVRLVEMMQRHSREGFCAFDDPLEAALFAVLVELVKEVDRQRDRGQQREADCGRECG
ncbi:MAG: hypothetical protein QMD46_02970 [Methanomicrobiales archaeon]|nr:hypothetical protein [Methanomicrobiales archaeon]MDI6875396.1 hypothetical protein [Methanomicrobiales archaeon]